MEIEAFKRVLSELADRPREVICSILIEGRPAREVAVELNVSMRTVESDLRQALKHCAQGLGRKLISRLGGPRPQS